MDEEEAIAWQDVLDEIFAGRRENLGCPFCGAYPLSITDNGPRTRIQCTKCGKFIEGTFGGY